MTATRYTQPFDRTITLEELRRRRDQTARAALAAARHAINEARARKVDLDDQGEAQ